MPSERDAVPAGHPLALREGGDRRSGERRTSSRGGPDRRRSQRRRQWLSHALLTSLTLAAPMTASAAKSRPPSTLSRHAPGGATTPQRPYEDLIMEAAAIYGLEPQLLRAIVEVESQFNPRAVSRGGAKGLMQLRPILLRELRVRNPFDPRQNVMGGARYLRRLLDMHEGDIRLALASYNAGPRNVTRYGGVPPFRETLAYIERILTLLEQGADS